MKLTFDEFKGSCYFITDYIKIPYLNNMKLESKDYLKGNKWNIDKLNSKLRELYDENIEKFK